MPLYDLEVDHQAGFENAVKNGQTRLALEYAVVIINGMKSEIEELKCQAHSPAASAKASSSSVRKETKQTSDSSDV